MGEGRNRVCPVELAGGLDNRIRRWLQKPGRILEPYVREGMTVVDVGCGPGFFTIEMAMMVGASGTVIAVDVQEGMLEKVRAKIRGTEIEPRIRTHKCGSDSIGVSERADFALAFYMVHETPDKEKFFRELHAIVKPGGQALIVEPKLFHVSRAEFESLIHIAENAGFQIIERPGLFLSWSAVFGRK